MKKRIYFILILLFLTGCDVKYTVEFTNETAKEDIFIFTDNNTFVERLKEKENQEEVAYQMYLLDDGYHNFKRELKYDENNAGFNYHTEFSTKKKQNWDTLANQCYENIKIIKEEENIIIESSDEFLCYDKFDELENVTIFFKTNYEVIDHNADSTSSSKYIWRITEEETYKPLYIKMKKKKGDIEEIKTTHIPFVLIILTIILIISIVIFVKKRKKNNDF